MKLLNDARATKTVAAARRRRRRHAIKRLKAKEAVDRRLTRVLGDHVAYAHADIAERRVAVRAGVIVAALLMHRAYVSRKVAGAPER